MKGCLGFTTKTAFVIAHVVVGFMYFISLNIDKFANAVGKIGFNAFGHRIPGEGLKALVKLVSGPFHLVGDNIKQLLIIDLIIILCFLIWAIIKRIRQKKAISSASTAETAEEKKKAFTEMMDSFKGE